MTKRPPPAILSDELERLDQTSGSTISRLTERRSCPRHRRRLLVEWAADGFASAGFTHDLSATGMFVCSLHIPERDLTLTMNLAHPDGRKIRLRGVIVRSYRVAPSMRRARRSGFCVRLIEAPEDYFVLVAELLHLQIPDEQFPDDEPPCELPDEQLPGEQLTEEAE